MWLWTPNVDILAFLLVRLLGKEYIHMVEFQSKLLCLNNLLLQNENIALLYNLN